MRVLVLEDETTLRENLADRLRDEGFVVDAVGEGTEGAYYACEYPLDLAIVDLGLPGRSGLEVVKALVNAGGFEWRRTTGDHAQLYYEHPTNEQDRQQVTVLLHDELRAGTLRDIADNTGADEFDAFCE